MILALTLVYWMLFGIFLPLGTAAVIIILIAMALGAIYGLISGAIKGANKNDFLDAAALVFNSPANWANPFALGVLVGSYYGLPTPVRGSANGAFVNYPKWWPRWCMIGS